MANPFTAHGISHLSASQLTTFASDPSRWFAQKVLGYRSPSGAAMERGKAIEDGCTVFLKGSSMDDACAAALKSYDRACRFSGVLGDIAKERLVIEDSVKLAAAALAKFGEPEWPESGQHKIQIDIRFGDGAEDTIPVLGYLDYMFPDRVIDLKSTSRIPTDMSFAHRIGAAIYARTTNRKVQYLYASSKKTLLLEDSDVAASQAAVRSLVKRMAAFLALSPDKEILRNAVPIITDSWGWRGEEDARRQLFGV